MRYCIKCNQVYSNCYCTPSVINNELVINSDQAGFDGESAYLIAKRLGKIPQTMTEGQYIDSLKGADGEDAEVLSPQDATDIFG